RAQLLGRWWLNNGTELNYSIGEKKQLKAEEATEVKFFPGASAIGVDLSSIFSPQQGSNDYIVTVGLQSSKETLAGTSQTAACFLMRNQNEKDLSAIAIYYDKIFSTLMFAPVLPVSRLTGVVTNPNRQIVVKVPVVLTTPGPGPIPPGPLRFETMTDELGRYEFLNVVPGKYHLTVGDQTSDVEVKKSRAEIETAVEINVRGVRRILDLSKAPVWEVALALGISAAAVRRVSRVITRICDADDLASALQMDRTELDSRLQGVNILWPRTELGKIAGIRPRETAQLVRA